MKLIGLFLSCVLAYPQSTIEAGPSPGWQIQQSHVLPMLIYFSSDQCLECEQFDALFEQPEMLQQLEQHYVSVRVSIDDINGKACADIYRIETVPAFVVADQKGVILYRSDKSLSVEDIRLLMEHVPGTSSTVNAPEDKIAEDGASMEAFSSPGDLQSALPVTSPSSVDVPVGKLQDDGAAPVVHAEESKHVQILPVATNAQKTQLANAPTLVTNVSPALNEDAAMSESTVSSNDTNTKPAASTSSPSTVEAAKPVVSKSSPVRVQRSYSIQLGYFSEAVNSNKLELRAKAKGLTETRTQTESREGKSYYRVLIGDFKTLAAAQAQLAEVHALGFKGAVHRQ